MGTGTRKIQNVPMKILHNLLTYEDIYRLFSYCICRLQHKNGDIKVRITEIQYLQSTHM